MTNPIQSHRNYDFMEPYNLVQLADDTENEISLVTQFQSLIKFSENKFQMITQSKRMYVHM